MKLTTCLTIACLVSAGATVIKGTSPRAGSNGSPSGSSQADAALIERFLQSGRPELTSYAARRLLTASTWEGRMEARLDAWTYLDPDGTFRFDIIREEGSELIRERVLVAALETEQRSRDPQHMARSALTRANYHFEVAEPAADGMVAIRLLPRRRSPMLVEGLVLTRQDNGDLVRIDGRLSDLPSWWTKRVDIVRRYTRIRGVRVPIEMASSAEVRVAGASTFSMTYRYTMINGQPTDEPMSPHFAHQLNDVDAAPFRRQRSLDVSAASSGAPLEVGELVGPLHRVHLLEAGYDIRTVQELLGHRDIRTTIYLHVMNRGALGVKSPMDRL